jgi:RNA polymerase sigma-70 factor (ECF subfamily)
MASFMDILERWYTAHADAVFAFALNLTRDAADAQDVLQEVFRRLAARDQWPDDVRSERAFLLTMTHRAVLDEVRSRKRREQRHETLAGSTVDLFASTPDPDEAAFRNALSTAMMELPEPQRVVAHLKLWEGWTFEEIGELLGITGNTAASRHRCALEKLRTHLRPIYEEI